MEYLRTALKRIGLSNQEIEAYVKLLYLGESTASNLGKEMKTHRRGIYDAVERLIKKGLISYSKKEGKTYYRALSPMKVIDLLNEKENEIREAGKNLSKNMQKIENLIRQGDSDIDVRILWGKEGIKAMYMDEIKDSGVVEVICSPIEKTEIVLNNFLPAFTRKRIKKKVKLRMLTCKRGKSIMKSYGLSETRLLPENYSSPAGITIYRDKVGITLWEEDPVTILIKNGKISDSFKKHFEMMWKAAGK